MASKVKVDSVGESQLQITLVVDDSESQPLVFNAVEAGPIAAHLLNHASALSRKSGKRPSLPADVTTIQMTAMSVGSSDIPDHETLVFYFGDSALGIAIPKPMLKQMGENFLALSAPESKPQ